MDFMKISLLLLYIFGNLAQVFAAEADHFSLLFDGVEYLSSEEKDSIDANKLITINTENFLKSVLKGLNERQNCSDMAEKTLYKELKKVFSNHSKGQLVKDILYTEKYPKISINLADSIYADWSVLNGYLLGKKGAANSPLALSPLIVVSDVTVGIDKFEHLFGMGYQYFDQAYLRGHSLKKVLKRGIFFEKTILGGNILATGVFSYGDLAANFNGMRFWNHMLQKRDDVLGPEYNIGPYLECRNEKWVQVKPIDFSHYMDYSMDESINCSKFASKGAVKKYISKLAENNLECPLRPNLLEDMFQKYSRPTPGDKKMRPLSHWILNREGVEKVSYLNEF